MGLIWLVTALRESPLSKYRNTAGNGEDTRIMPVIDPFVLIHVLQKCVRGVNAEIARIRTYSLLRPIASYDYVYDVLPLWIRSSRDFQVRALPSRSPVFPPFLREEGFFVILKGVGWYIKWKRSMKIRMNFLAPRRRPG